MGLKGFGECVDIDSLRRSGLVREADGTCASAGGVSHEQLLTSRLALRLRRLFSSKPQQPLCVGSQNAVLATRDSRHIKFKLTRVDIFPK